MKYIKIIIVLFFFTSITNATICDNPKFKVNDVCQDDNCHSTLQVDFSLSDDIPNILENTTFIEIPKISTWLDGRFDIYKEKFNDRDFVINDFCKIRTYKKNQNNRYEICLDDNKSDEWIEGGPKDCYVGDEENPDEKKDFDGYACEEGELIGKDCYVDKYDCDGDEYFTFEQIIDYSDNFMVNDDAFDNDSEYINGIDYFFNNSTNILSEIDYYSEVTSIDDVIPNFLSYQVQDNKNQFTFRNVCDNSICLNTALVSYFSSSNDELKLLNGDNGILSIDDFNKPSFLNDSFNYSGNGFIAGEGVDVNFQLKDLLPNSGCDTFDYNYKITYKYKNSDGSFGNEEIFVEDVIKISTGGLALNDDNNIGEFDEKNIGYTANFDENTRYLTININEGVNLTKAGEVYFFVEMENYIGKKLEKVSINSIGVNIYPGEVSENHIKTRMEKYLFDETKKYETVDALYMRTYLYDIYGNNYCNTFDGIKINHTSTKVKFYDGMGYNIDTLSGLNSQFDGGEECFYQAQFGMIDDGEYSQKFTFFTPKVDESGTYIGYNNPFQLSIGDFKYTIHPTINIASSEFTELECSSTPFRIEANCLYDATSGCNNNRDDKSILFFKEAQNGTTGTLEIWDKAYWPTPYNFVMAHYDTTEPDVVITNWPTSSNVFQLASSDKIKVQIKDVRPSGCYGDLVYVDLSINGGTPIPNPFIQKANESNLLEFSTDILSKVGVYDLKFTYGDSVGNTGEILKTITIFPDYPYVKTITDSTGSTIILNSTLDSKYANNINTYSYTLRLRDKYGNPIYSGVDTNTSKTLISINQDCQGVGGCETLTVDETLLDNTLSNVINEDFTGPIDSNGNLDFTVKSLSPGLFTEQFVIKYNDWTNEYINLPSIEKSVLFFSSNNNSFKKPIIGEIEVSNSGSLYSNLTAPKVSTAQFYKVNLLNIGSISTFSGSLDISETSIINKVAGHSWDDFVISNNNKKISNSKLYSKFEGTINAVGNILAGTEIESNNLVISYKIGTNPLVKYFLTKQTEGDDGTELFIGGEERETLGLKIIGTLQGDGKASITGQEENFSDLSKSELRNSIRKNAYKLIKGMESDTVINNVKFYDGDKNGGEDYVMYGDDTSFETLIVKNANVIITKSKLNLSGKKLGIIVLSDGYNAKEDFSDKGNIYIDKGVTYIDAALYADGGIISSEETGTDVHVPFITNNALRTSKLQKQLIIKGSIFTRNTIGGSVEAGGFYKLPGGGECSIFDIAMIFDLNYIRVGNEGCTDIDDSGDCTGAGEYNDPFVIIYNPNIQTNPPKGFGK